MPNKHSRKNPGSINSGYTQPDQILENQPAESRLKATVTGNQLKSCFDLAYGTTPHLRVVDKKTKQAIGCTVLHTARRLSDDITTDFIMDDGEVIPVDHVKAIGFTVSSFIQAGKYKQ